MYEKDRPDFADAYLVAMAVRSGVGVVASFKAIDRVDTVRYDPAGRFGNDFVDRYLG